MKAVIIKDGMRITLEGDEDEIERAIERIAGIEIKEPQPVYPNFPKRRKYDKYEPRCWQKPRVKSAEDINRILCSRRW